MRGVEHRAGRGGDGGVPLTDTRAGVDGHGPAVAMDHTVVVATEEDHVADVGGPAMAVGHQVVGVTPVGWGIAAGEDAAPVSGDEPPTLF